MFRTQGRGPGRGSARSGPAIRCTPTEFLFPFILSSTVTFQEVVDDERDEDEGQKSTEYTSECGGYSIDGNSAGRYSKFEKERIVRMLRLGGSAMEITYGIVGLEVEDEVYVWELVSLQVETVTK